MTHPEAAALNSAERTANAFNGPVRGRLMCKNVLEKMNKWHFRRLNAKVERGEGAQTADWNSSRSGGEV